MRGRQHVRHLHENEGYVKGPPQVPVFLADPPPPLVRTKLEQEARGMAGPKRPFRSTSGPSPTVEPAVSPDGSFASLPASNRDDYRLHKKYGSTGASSANRPGSDQFARVPLATNSKPPPVPASGQHKRASSVLSLSARQIIGAWQQGQDETDKSSKRLSVGQAEDDFDALIRSGETMRVSLTPSRLSTFDVSWTQAERGAVTLTISALLHLYEQAGQEEQCGYQRLHISTTILERVVIVIQQQHASQHSRIRDGYWWSTARGRGPQPICRNRESWHCSSFNHRGE